MAVLSWIWMLLILFRKKVVTGNLTSTNCDLSVSFGAVSDTEDSHGTTAKGEQNTVVSETQTKGAGHVAVQSGDVARSSTRKTQDAVENAHRGIAINSTYVGGCVVEPFNSIMWQHLSQVFRLDSGANDNVVHWNPFAAMICEPGLTVLKTTAILFGYRFIVGWRDGEGPRYRVDHDFEQTGDCVDLLGVELLDQLVDVLSIFECISGHGLLRASIAGLRAVSYRWRVEVSLPVIVAGGCGVRMCNSIFYLKTIRAGVFT